jgi:phenylalanyl-tRNA synthetase beta chain
MRVKPLPRFPATERDLAMIVDDHVAAQAVLEFTQSLGQALIEGVEIFDVYKGASMPPGKKSMALRFTYRSSERNLTDDEVNAIHETVIEQTLGAFKGQLPTGGGG